MDDDERVVRGVFGNFIDNSRISHGIVQAEDHLSLIDHSLKATNYDLEYRRLVYDYLKFVKWKHSSEIKVVEPT